MRGSGRSIDSLPTSTLRALKTVSFGIGVGGSYGCVKKKQSKLRKLKGVANTSQHKTKQEQDMANITMIQNEAKYKPTTEELIKSNFFNDKRSNRISKSYRFALDTELEKLDVVGLKRLEILLRVWFSTQITVFHKTQQIKTCFFFL